MTAIAEVVAVEAVVATGVTGAIVASTDAETRATRKVVMALVLEVDMDVDALLLLRLRRIKRRLGE